MATEAGIIQLLEYLTEAFHTFQLGEKTRAVWSEQLAKFSDQQVKRGLDHFIQTSGSAYPPEIPQLIKAIRESASPGHAQTVKALPEPELDTAEGLRILRTLMNNKMPGVLSK